MRHHQAFTTYTISNELGEPGEYVYVLTVSGYLESIQYIKHGSNPVTDTMDIGIFYIFDESNLAAFPIFLKNNVAASFLAHPRVLTQKASDGTDTTQYEKIYLANERIAITINDTEGGSAGGKQGNLLLRFSEADPVRR